MQESVHEVQQIVQEERPDMVLLELCASRLYGILASVRGGHVCCVRLERMLLCGALDSDCRLRE